MKIGIIDADLIAIKKHKFPNLVSMKISGYYKEKGCDVKLITDYSFNNKDYDKIFLSKVFTNTNVPPLILSYDNIEWGGTGFFYDKAPRLPDDIEHHMPDYHLYDDYINEQLSKGISKTSLKYYTDYSIGFLTRGCFRQCSFCVNKNYTKCVQHSPLKEFYDSSRPKICLLDDNFFACPKWKDIMVELKSLNIPFQFRQGLDERLLTDEKCKMLLSSKYDGDFIFAFDDINDKELIENKLQIINKYSNNKRIKFYVLCGYDRNGKYDLEFWKQDLFDLFERINILLKHKAIPYIMRHENYKNSPYNGTYIHVARWCNQVNMLKKMSYREFCYLTDSTVKSKSSCLLYFEKVENEIPELASKYFDMKLLNFEKGCCNF